MISISGLDNFYLIKGDKKDERWYLDLEGIDNYIIGFDNPEVRELGVNTGQIRVISSNESNKIDIIKIVLLKF